MAKRGRKCSDPFEGLETEFKDAIAGMSPEDINKRISDVAKNQEENLKLMKEDQDLSEKKELAKEAAAQYREASKSNRLKIQYCVRVLGDKGAA